MNNKPRFSFLMPAYNAESFIGRAIESVLAQTMSDWELVITNDGSHDGTAAVVERYCALPQSRGRIRLINQENAGCGAARDTSAQHARGTYFVRFDADDELMPEYLERMNNAILTYPGHDIYCCNGINRLPDGKTSPARKGSRYDHPQEFTIDDLFEFVHIFTIALYSADIYHKVGHINPSVYCEDVCFWFDCFLEGATCQFIPETLAYYTVSDSQMTADFDRVAESCIGIYQALIESGRLSDEHSAHARAAIERTKNDVAIFHQRQGLITRAEKLLGPSGAKLLSAVIHGLGKVVRPLYAALLSRRRRGHESDAHQNEVK